MSVDRILSVESGGDAYARNPRSTATGAGQFIEGTWLDMISRHRPDLITGMSRDQILQLRTDPNLSREMTEAYSNENKGLLGKAGVPVTDGTAYLAHFAGPQGAIKVLQADPTAKAGDILGPAVVKANPFLANMTAGDLAAWADKKMGGSTQPPAAMPKPQTPAQPAMAQPMGGILTQAPQAPQGIMAPPQQAQGLLAPPDQPDEAWAMPMKPLQHLQIPKTPPRRGFAFKGYRA